MWYSLTGEKEQVHEEILGFLLFKLEAGSSIPDFNDGCEKGCVSYN